MFALTLVRVNDQFDLVSSSFRRSFGTIGSCALTSQSNVNHFMLRICIMSGSKKKRETRTSHEGFCWSFHLPVMIHSAVPKPHVQV